MCYTYIYIYIYIHKNIGTDRGVFASRPPLLLGEAVSWYPYIPPCNNNKHCNNDTSINIKINTNQLSNMISISNSVIAHINHINNIDSIQPYVDVHVDALT